MSEMSEMIETGRPVSGFSRSLTLWADRQILRFARHWLAALNTFFFLYVGLPLLAPILMAIGYTGPANGIYALYRVACHQLPSRSYFIFGEQIALCERCLAIYGIFFLGGIVFNFIRYLKPPSLRWYLFFLVPMAVDGGMQMASELLNYTSITTLWAIGLVVMGILMAILNSQKYLTWHTYLFLASGPLALLYLQFVDPNYTSNWLMRTITGTIFAVGTVWFAYPYLEESFAEIEEELETKLARAARREQAHQEA